MAADPLDTALLRLAHRFEALRKPCKEFHTMIESDGMTARARSATCVEVFCRGWTPAATLEALLGVCRGFYLVEMWPPEKDEPWEADIQRKEGEWFRHGEGPTPLEALARALDAATGGQP